MTWEKFKSYSPREKLDYIWDYFRWHILIAIVILCLLVSWIYGIATHKDPLLRIVMINSYGENSSSESFESFLEQSGYEYYDGAVTVNKNIQLNSDSPAINVGAMEILVCTLAARDADIYFWNEPKLYPVLEDGTLMDLRQVISEDLLEQYKDNLIYGQNPDTGEQYPCAVWLQENPWIRENQYYVNCAAGIAVGADKIEVAGQFLTYLLSY